MRLRTILLLATFVLTIQSACATIVSDKRAEGVVVERNKQTRPIWADSPTNKLVVNDTETRYHFAIVRQRDLPIAVKQAQTSAIKESFALWRSVFGESLGDVSQVKRLQSATKQGKDLTQILDVVASKLHSDLAQIEDIYYERIRIDNYGPVPELKGVPEYFDVHTLVKIAPLDLEKMKISLGTELLAARHPEFKKVGRELSVTAKK
jgi:hypothetical protein